MNVTEYWALVREERQKLGPATDEKGSPVAFTLVSVAHRATGTVPGVVTEADHETAARRIADGTHRLATKQEIAQYKAWQESQRQAIAEQEYQRKQQFALPKELAELVRAVTAAGQGVPPQEKK